MIYLTRREFRSEKGCQRGSERRFLLPPGVIPMSVATLQPSASCRFAVPPEPVLPLTVGQYHAMIRAGELESGDPIELLEGWLVTKMSKVGKNGSTPLQESRCTGS